MTFSSVVTLRAVTRSTHLILVSFRRIILHRLIQESPMSGRQSRETQLFKILPIPLSKDICVAS